MGLELCPLNCRLYCRSDFLFSCQGTTKICVSHRIRKGEGGEPDGRHRGGERIRTAGLAGARPIELTPFECADAARFVENVIGTERARAEQEAAHDIAKLCDYLPLALRAATARLASHPDLRLAVLAGRLANEKSRLSELATGPFDVRQRLLRLYQQMDELQRAAFQLVATCATPHVDAANAARSLGVSTDRAEQVLEELVETQLVRVSGAGVFPQFHASALVQLFGDHIAGSGQFLPVYRTATC